MKMAADRIADSAKRFAGPLMSERTYLNVMTMGAEVLIHELEMGLIARGKRSISVIELSRLLREQRQAIEKLTEGGK
jgi:hypothetical protein